MSQFSNKNTVFIIGANSFIGRHVYIHLKRLNKHNNNEGAKFTKGSSWQLIYFKKYKDKKIAMRDEYKLKKDYKLRSKLKTNYINK